MAITSPQISVIIPSYNHEQFVARAIESVLSQTFQNFEIVIVDDGSSDGTVAEIQRYRDPRIRFFSFPINQGACAAAEKCISESRGQYIAMLSSDDEFLPHKLETQIRFLNERPDIAAVFGRAHIIDESGNAFKNRHHFYCSIFNQQNKTRHEWLRHFFFHGNCLCHPSVLIRRQCYDTIGVYDKRYAQLPDFDFWIRLCMHFEIFILQEPLINFRILSANANTSAPKPEVFLRAKYEYMHILRHYLGIQTLDELARVFPELCLNPQDKRHSAVPFLLAMLSISINERHHALFAISTLFDLLDDADTAAWLKSEFEFTINDFYLITGSVDALNMGIELEAENFFPFRLKRRINKKLGRAAPGADIQAITRKFFDRFNNA